MPVLVMALAIGCVSFPLSIAQAQTPAWVAWAKAGKPAIESVATGWSAIESATNADNNAALKADFIKFSNDTVVLASIDDSPSAQLNRIIIETGLSGNSCAWTGYIYVATMTSSALSRFKYEAALFTKDLNSMTAIMTANGF
jgi:hypothetical protein